MVCIVLSAVKRNAVAKLNVVFRDRVHYCDLAETPVRDTSFTAFTVAVSLNGRHYVGVAKTKKAARNVAAQRALVAVGLWTIDDEYAKAEVTTELDEDPVEAVYRMRDAIARERLDLGGRKGGSRWQWTQWNPEVQGGVGRGWDGRQGDDRSWGGLADPVSGEWCNQGPGDPRWDHPGRGGSFDMRRGQGRPGIFHSRGFRGGGYSEPFPRNMDTSNTNSGGSWPRNSWNRGNPDSSGRGHLGKAFESRPVPPNMSTPSRFSSQMTATPSSVPLVQFTSDPVPASTSSPWSYAVDPASGIYQPSTNQNQAGFPSAVQPSATYLPATASTVSTNFGGGFVQPWSQVQSAGITGALPSYGSYGETAQTGYNWVYNQGSYTPF